MKRVLALVVVVFFATPDVLAKASLDARHQVGKLAASVQARQGIQFRSLVVVPLVLRGNPPTGGPAVTTKELWWSHASTKGTRVEFTSTASNGPPSLLPSGFVLRDGMAERLLVHPALVPAGPGTAVRVATCALQPSPPDGVRMLDLVAPPEYRHVLRALNDAKALTNVLAIQGILAALDPAKPAHLLDLRSATVHRKRMAEASSVLSPLGTSYGGATVGHVAFRGNRVIEVVLARSPNTYSTYWHHAVAGLAHSVVFWEELHSLTDERFDDVQWLLFLDAANRTMRRIAHVQLKRQRVGKGALGTTWRVGPHRPSKTQLRGWYLQGTAGEPVLFEAWGSIALNPLRPPKQDAARPEIPSVPASPDAPDDEEGADGKPSVKGGAMTLEALERLLRRLRERRAEIEAKKRQKR